MPASPPPPASPDGSSRSGDRSWHPPVETLAAHLRGELPPAEADQVREHITGCTDCIELLLDLDAFEGSAGDEDAAGEGGTGEAGAADRTGDAIERAESWRRLLAQRPWDEPAPGEDPPREAAEAVAPVPPPPPLASAHAVPARPSPAPRAVPGPPRAGQRRSRFRRLPWRTVLVAASLVVAALSGLWSLNLHDQLTAPHPDHPIVELTPAGVTRSGGAGEDAFEVPPESSFTAMIVPEAEGPFERYQVELAEEAGRAVWTGELRPADPAAPYPTLSLGLSRRMLPDRRYTLRLWGLTGDRRTEAGIYPIEFTE